MIQRLSQKILQILINNEAVTKGQEAIIVFGIEQGLRTGMSIVLMVLTGLIMNVFWQSIIILISYFPVRIYAGGYHAKTPIECTVKSWCLFAFVLLFYKYIPMDLPVQVAIIIATGICIYSLSPVQNENKPLKEYEIHKYRKKSIKNFLIVLAVFCVTHTIKKTEIALCVVMGMFMVFLMLILGESKNRKQGCGKK